MAELDGIDVLVTRPRAQAEPWARTLAEQGGCPLVVPLMELQALTEPDEVQAIKNRILDFDLYQKAIFVSQNAVAYAFEWLHNYWPQLPLGVGYFGVGERTAAALKAQGVTVTALQHQGAMNSESLLQAPELHAVSDQRIVIFRGQGGRGLMAQALRERGARVDLCELYRRRRPPDAVSTLTEAINTETDRPLVVALHSGETLDNYAQTLIQLPDGSVAARRLHTACLLVPGQRVAERAQALGFDRVIAAENATDSSMLAALQSAAQTFFNGSRDRD